MIWQNSEFFFMFLPLVLVALWIYQSRNRRRPSVRTSGFFALSKAKKSWRVSLKWLPTLLKTVALVLVIFPLARPQKADERVKKNIEGIDIVMTLDISESMLIEDMKPVNRLESAKKTIEQFVLKRESDRIGLVVFSGESYTRVPLTLDYPVLLQNLSKVKTTRSIKMGTAIGVALANASSRLKDSKAKSRVVILLTDGENNTGLIDPLTALRIAKGYGLRIYTIGVGLDGMAQLPITNIDAFGNKTKRYQPMHSKVNVDLLGKLANDTGGKFYRATDTGGLQTVFDDIDRLEKSKIEVNKYVRYQELFQSYLFWAVLLYGLSILLSHSVLRRGV